MMSHGGDIAPQTIVMNCCGQCMQDMCTHEWVCTAPRIGAGSSGTLSTRYARCRAVWIHGCNRSLRNWASSRSGGDVAGSSARQPNPRWSPRQSRHACGIIRTVAPTERLDYVGPFAIT
jgi:hypothetical protein